MHPLNYQVTNYSCWVTSMTNGLLVLHGDKKRIAGLVYRLLHAVLTEEGVYTHSRPGNDISTLLAAIRIRTKIKVRHYDRDKVADAIRKLNFKHQVAVCLVNSGVHAILLTGKCNGWYEAFDPDWDGVKKRRVFHDAYITQPEIKKKSRRGRVNLLIQEDYLFRSRGGKYGGNHLGAVSTRSLTVLERR